MKPSKLFFIALTLGAMAASPALARPATVMHSTGRNPVIARSGAQHWAHNGDWRRHRHHNRSHVFFSLGYPFGYGYPYYGYYPYGYGYYAGPSEAVYQAGDRSIVIEVQRRLARAGYYRGAIDGVAGAGTRSAIRSYERTHGLRVDGLIDQRLLATMGLA
jgi:Putative peptidoglycan binding domain